MFRRFASLVAAALPLLAVSAGAEPRVKIAVLPVVVHALEQKDYLQSGIADMIATRLEQNGKVAVARIADVSQATTDGEAARAAARAAGADYVVFGSFTRFGDGASLDLRCLPTAGAKGDLPKGVFVQAGKVGEIIPRLDDVAAKIAGFALSGGEGAPAVAAGPPGTAATSTSPEAIGDALSELDELRSRVERLEGALYGKEGAGAPQGAGKQP
jgi:outer membrane protein insertion porin family